MLIKKKVIYPSKKTVNLVVYKKTINSPTRAIPAFVAFLLLLSIFVKIGVIDELARVSLAQNELSQQQQLLDTMVSYNEDYDDVLKEYNRYSNDYLTPDEAYMTDRLDLITLFETTVMGEANIPSLTISGDTCQMVLTDVTLDRVASIVADLQQSDLITYIAVSTAGTSNNNGQNGEAAPQPGSQPVTANLTITLGGNSTSGGGSQ